MLQLSTAVPRKSLGKLERTDNGKEEYEEKGKRIECEVKHVILVPWK
jgi:hypothetical protein